MIAFGKRACEGRERQGKPQELCCCDRGRIIFFDVSALQPGSGRVPP